MTKKHLNTDDDFERVPKMILEGRHLIRYILQDELSHKKAFYKLSDGFVKCETETNGEPEFSALLLPVLK